MYRQMQPMADMAEIMPATFAPWSAADFALNFLFWWAMMPGMMLPSAAPMILMFAAINRKKRGRAEPYVPTAVFTAGYLAAWGVFGAVATLADWGLERAALISPATGALGPLLGRGGSRRCRTLSIDAVKDGLPRALPLAARLCSKPLA